LSNQTLDIIINVLDSMSFLSLAREPRDCIEAFSNFISERVSELDYVINNEDDTRVVV
jgi:hypothetical protein